MEFPSLETCFCFLFFSFSQCFTVFSLLIFLLGLTKPWCDCEVCRSYMSSSWSSEFENLCDWYSHLLRQSRTGTIHVHVMRNIITSNPQNVEHMLKTRFENYPKGKAFSDILGDLLGRGIFNVDGELWRFQRKMASLELGSISVRCYAFQVIMEEISQRLIPLLSSFARKEKEDGVAVLDLQDIFRRFSFDSICRIAFGLDPGCLEQSLPVSIFQVAFDVASKISAERAMTTSTLVWRIKRFLSRGSEKKLKEAIGSVNVLARDIIAERRKMGGLSSHKDLLSRFMANAEDDEFLRDIVISFLLAGRDTVASSLTSFFWLLAHHPGATSAIREESDLVMNPSQDFASFEQIKEMRFLHAAVHESMRLYPPVQFDSKFAKEDDLLPDGTFVRKGTRVTYHPYAMGRMDRVWGPDYLEFKPERWLKEEDGGFRAECPFKYPVFQAGPRVCLGKDIALLEMKSVALSLIRRFDIQLATSGPPQPPRFAPGLTATVRGGLPVLVRRRPC